jgi:hypothetical protein
MVEETPSGDTIEIQKDSWYQGNNIGFVTSLQLPDTKSKLPRRFYRNIDNGMTGSQEMILEYYDDGPSLPFNFYQKTLHLKNSYSKDGPATGDTIDTEYVFEMSAAGYSTSGFTMKQNKNILKVYYTDDNRPCASNVDVEYLYKGLTSKDFIKVFSLGENVKIEKLHFNYGLFIMNLRWVDPVPEETIELHFDQSF